MAGAQFKAEYYSGKDNAQPVYLVDANGNLYAAGGTTASTAINDGIVTSQKATVSAFHSSDNQSPGGTAYALFTGGVAQIYNPAGTLDRQRGTGIDAIPAVGVATGTQQLAGPAQTTTLNGAVTGSAVAQTITVASTTNLKVGDLVTTSDNVESAEIITIPSSTTCTMILTKNHANGAALTWFHYNQARDATVGDNVAGTGIAPSATFLYNNISGYFEYDRSANGEKDGASGFGTAVAAEYEWNGGGPLNNSNVISGLQFDRARNLQAKSLGAGTISNNPLAAASTTFTLNAAPTTLMPGQQILLDRAGANPEANYVATSYTAGATSVALQNATAFSHVQNATVEWDQFAALGPGLNGFTAAGIGIEEEALYNPADGKYYIERSATADAMASANVVAESPALWNGATMDRLRGDATGAARVSLYGKNAAVGDTAIKVDNNGYVQTNVNNFPSNQDGQTAITSATFTTNQTSGNQNNYNQRGCNFFIKSGTFGTGATGIVVSVQGIDPASGNTTWTLLQSAALTASAFQVLTVYPGVVAAANVAANAVMPRTWNVTITATNWGTGGSTVGVTYGQIL